MGKRKETVTKRTFIDGGLSQDSGEAYRQGLEDGSRGAERERRRNFEVAVNLLATINSETAYMDGVPVVQKIKELLLEEIRK